MSKLIKATGMFFSRQGSKILIATSIVSTGTAVILAARSTTKYDLLIEEMKEEKGRELNKKEKIKPMMKAYWPSILLAVLSGACAIGSHVIDKKHQAVLAAALTASNTALSEFQAKTLEKIGEKKVTEIKDAIAKDHIEKKPVDPNTVIITPSKGKVLMFDNFSGRYFYSDVESLRRAVNNINRRVPDEMYCTLNELYLELGMPEINMGNQLGWHIDYNPSFEEVLSAHITDNGEPCIVVSYSPEPSPEGWFHGQD